MTLQNQLHPSKYNQIVFDAVADSEPMEDVNTITLKGEYTKKVEALAIKNLTKNQKRITAAAVMVEMSKIFKSKQVTVQEAVYHTKEGISVVADVDAIDDEAIGRVFQLVQDALYQLDGQYGTVRFGTAVSYEKHEIPWLVVH